MAELKPGWHRVKFGELVHHIAERAEPQPADNDTYVGLEHLETGSLLVRRWGSQTTLVGTKLRMRKGDILFARRNAYLRRVALAPHDGLFSAHGMVLRPKAPFIVPEFLPFFMQSDAFMDRAESISVGSLSPTINWTALREEEFALPPIADQARIASALQQASALMEALRNAMATAEAARSSLIVRLYKNGTSGESTKSTSIGMVPEPWTVEPLGNRFTIQLGKMISKEAVTGARGGKQTPYLRNANIQWNRLDLNDVSTMAFTAQEKEKFSLRPGDILACEGRHVGKSAIWRNEIPGACYQKALHRLRAKGEDLPEYLLYCLFFYSITGRFSAITGETTIPHLPAEKLRAIEVAFPPLKEQVDIVRRIASFDASLAALASRLSRASLLVKSFGLELS